MFNFEDKLDLVNYLDKDILPNTERKYKLYGVVYRTGNLRFGHYYACIDIGLNDQWTKFNDSSVSSMETFEKENSYILFYIKIKFILYIKIYFLNFNHFSHFLT